MPYSRIFHTSTPENPWPVAGCLQTFPCTSSKITTWIQSNCIGGKLLCHWALHECWLNEPQRPLVRYTGGGNKGAPHKPLPLGSLLRNCPTPPKVAFLTVTRHRQTHKRHWTVIVAKAAQAVWKRKSSILCVPQVYNIFNTVTLTRMSPA